MTTPSITALLTKLLHQTRIVMGNGESVSANFCRLCEGRGPEVITRGIHSGDVYRCDCFCHDARKLLTGEASPTDKGDTFTAEAIADLQKPAAIEVVKAPQFAQEMMPLLTAVSEVLQSEAGPDLEQFLTEYIEAARGAQPAKVGKKKRS